MVLGCQPWGLTARGLSFTNAPEVVGAVRLAISYWCARGVYRVPFSGSHCCVDRVPFSGSHCCVDRVPFQGRAVVLRVRMDFVSVQSVRLAVSDVWAELRMACLWAVSWSVLSAVVWFVWNVRVGGWILWFWAVQNFRESCL